MALGNVIARLAVNLSLETAAFEKGATLAEKRMAQTQRKFAKLGGKISGIGKKMSLGLTAPLAAFGISAFQAASDAAEMESAFAVSFGNASASVKKWAIETGNAMGRSTQELMSMAASFQDILKKQMDPAAATELSKNLTVLTQDLASFKNLSNDVAQQKIFSGLIGEAEPLRSVGVLLSAQATDAKAAALGLAKVNGQYTEGAKVQARAALIMEQLSDAQGDVMRTGSSTENQIKRAKGAFEELQVTIGTKLLPVITPLISKIAGLIDYFANLPDGVQMAIVAVGGIAAVLGPVVFGIGQLISIGAPLLGFLVELGSVMAGAGSVSAALAAGFTGIATVLAPLLVPLAAVAAAGYLIYQNWDKIAPALQAFWQTAKETLGPPLQELISVISDTFSELWNGPIGAGVREAGAKLIEFQLAYSKVFGPVLLGVLKGAIKVLTEVFRTIGDGVHLVSALFKGEWQDALEAAASLANRLFFGLPAKITGYVAQMVQGVTTWLHKLGDPFQWVADKLTWVGKLFFDLYDKVVGHSYIPDMVDGIAREMGRLDAVMVDPAAKAARKTAEVMRDMAGEVRGLLDRLFPEIAKANQYKSDLALIAGSGLSDADKAKARMRLSREDTMGSPTAKNPVSFTDPGSLAADISKSMDAFESRMGLAADRTKATTVRIAKSFKDMAMETLGALQRMTSAIKGGGFLDILESVIGFGLQLGSIGAFGKTIQGNINSSGGIPGFATGTSSAPRGLALVGERGPELVNFRGGERVFSNADSRGMMGRRGGDTYNFSGNLMTPEFWDRIQAGDMSAAEGGAQLAGQRATFARSRQWG